MSLLCNHMRYDSRSSSKLDNTNTNTNMNTILLLLVSVRMYNKNVECNDKIYFICDRNAVGRVTRQILKVYLINLVCFHDVKSHYYASLLLIVCNMKGSVVSIHPQ